MIQFIYEHPKGNDYEGKIVVSIDETAAQYYKKEHFSQHQQRISKLRL